MSKSQRLKPVVKVAESREQKAAQEFSASQKALQDRQRQLAELIAYREEYNRQFPTGGGLVSAGRLQELHRFLARLNDAIAQQQRLLEAAARTCEHKRRDWNSARGRTLALEKVSERYQAEERQDAARREQREIDEMAQRSGLTADFWKKAD